MQQQGSSIVLLDADVIFDSIKVIDLAASIPFFLQNLVISSLSFFCYVILVAQNDYFVTFRHMVKVMEDISLIPIILNLVLMLLVLNILHF